MSGSVGDECRSVGPGLKAELQTLVVNERIGANLERLNDREVDGGRCSAVMFFSACRFLINTAIHRG